MNPLGSVKKQIHCELEYINRVRDWKSKALRCKAPPQQIWIEPTNYCNLRCIHCIQPQMTRPRGFMDFSLFRKVVDEAANHNIHINLCGQGEPLIHPKFCEMVKYACQRAYSVRVVTNATLLDMKRAKEILKAEPSWITFSFEGVTKEIYERIRRGANYEKTWRNIVNFIDMRDKMGKKTKIEISIIREPLTERKIQDFINKLLKLSVDSIAVNSLANWFGESDLVQAENIELNPRVREVCRTPWIQLEIHWDGKVVSCMLDYNNRWVIGNAKRDTLMEIWNGDGMMRFRKALRDRNYKEIEQNGPLCSQCDSLSFYPDSVYDRSMAYVLLWNRAGEVLRSIKKRALKMPPFERVRYDR